MFVYTNHEEKETSGREREDGAFLDAADGVDIGEHYGQDEESLPLEIEQHSRLLEGDRTRHTGGPDGSIDEQEGELEDTSRLEQQASDEEEEGEDAAYLDREEVIVVVVGDTVMAVEVEDCEGRRAIDSLTGKDAVQTHLVELPLELHHQPPL